MVLPAPAALFVLAFFGVDWVSLRFDEGDGVCTSFGGDLVMSALFLPLPAARRGTRGRSPAIALDKVAGTVCASLFMVSSRYLRDRTDAAAYRPPSYDSALMYGLCLACFLLDLAYVYVVFTVRRAERRAAGTGGHPRMALPA